MLPGLSTDRNDGSGGIEQTWEPSVTEEEEKGRERKNERKFAERERKPGMLRATGKAKDEVEEGGLKGAFCICKRSQEARNNTFEIHMDFWVLEGKFLTS